MEAPNNGITKSDSRAAHQPEADGNNNDDDHDDDKGAVGALITKRNHSRVPRFFSRNMNASHTERTPARSTEERLWRC